jgi:lipopolysaccharide/colanic/teichoic acid biosynthesis glycosyltransferase
MDFFRIQRPYALRLPRYQLSGGLIVAGVIPYLLRLLSFDDSASVALHTQTLFVVLASTALGYWFVRNFVAYPGVEKSSNIFTSLSIAYGIVVSILVVSRIEYSRFMLICGYSLSIAWFYWATITYARKTRFRVGLAPFGDWCGIEESTLVAWVKLSDPQNEKALIDAVAIDLRADMPDEWERALADFALSGIPVYHIKHLKESLTGQVDLEHISENNFGSLSPVSAYMTLKHIFDSIAAAVALVILLPVLVICGIAIKLDSRGPALFRQTRIGFQGKPFMVYKLRTMTTGGAQSQDALRAAMTQSNDVRVTKVGRFLRQTRLDELPQFINVLKGEMSWIGPRPEAQVLGNWYEADIPFYRYRHIVRPGITGWAQVNQGHVAEIEDVKQKLNYDFYYIKNFSPWLDMLIIARTVRTMMTGHGAR